DDAFAATLRARETQHLEHDFVFGLGALGAGIADVDRVGEDSAVDADIAVALALEVSADELAGGAFEDLHDLAARSESAAAGLAVDLDQHFVAARGIEDGLLRDVDFGRGLAVDKVRPDEAEAGTRLAKDAGGGAVRRRLPHGLVLAQLHASLLQQVAEHVAEV